MQKFVQVPYIPSAIVERNGDEFFFYPIFIGTSGINKHLAVPMKSKLFSLVWRPTEKKEIEIPEEHERFITMAL